jgi:hypothetical protein
MNAGPAIALAGACAVLFGASYAGAELTDGGTDADRAQPAAPTPAPTGPIGETLALTGADRLPDLRRRPRPKPKPAAAEAPAAPPAQGSAPATQIARAPSSGGAPAPSTPVEAAPQPDDFDSSGDQSPDPVQGPSSGTPQPAPAPTPAPSNPTDFYDSDG